MKNEKIVQSASGYLGLFILLILAVAAVGGAIWSGNALFYLLFIPFLFLLPGFFIVNPNGSKVLVLFGEYKGTVEPSLPHKMHRRICPPSGRTGNPVPRR